MRAKIWQSTVLSLAGEYRRNSALMEKTPTSILPRSSKMWETNTVYVAYRLSTRLPRRSPRSFLAMTAPKTFSTDGLRRPGTNAGHYSKKDGRISPQSVNER